MLRLSCRYVLSSKPDFLSPDSLSGFKAKDQARNSDGSTRSGKAPLVLLLMVHGEHVDYTVTTAWFAFVIP
ncbi:unnamed protein product [Brassica rapa]|uniref:Uncharacterized protein n=1 Tax=Brassica campestris TaxID=3711 RepID=A0A3P5ZI16_BRACM|nr:unnamed protein product [Brassica rapa]VDC72421.1 unnamed protein product [Brassica rapa]